MHIMNLLHQSVIKHAVCMIMCMRYKKKQSDVVHICAWRLEKDEDDGSLIRECYVIVSFTKELRDRWR